MIKRGMTLIGIILCSFFIISCAGNANNRDEIKLQTGTDGLTIDFMDKGVPNDVSEGSRLYVTFELINEGFYDIKRGKLILSLEEDFTALDSWDLPDGFDQESEKIIGFDLMGKSISLLRGERQVASVIIRGKTIEDTRNKIESIIGLTACYPYSSIFSDTMCIDTDPNNLKIAEKTCKARDITSSGQGGPVAITRIEQKVIPADNAQSVNLQLTIFAENKGEGIIINPDRYDQICKGTNIDKDDYNVVWLKSLKYSDYEYNPHNDGISEIVCNPNPMREIDGEYQTRCELKDKNTIDKSKLTFETPLVVEIEYGYKQSISKEIEILNDDRDAGNEY